jgi:hypothetical protein
VVERLRLATCCRGGTLANLAAAAVFSIALRSATGGSVRLRLFLLTSLAFNLLAGTGYFFFSGVTNFGDWAAVIAGFDAYWLWRALLVVTGLASYFGAVLVVGTGLVRYVGVPRNAARRLRKLTFIPYFSSVILLSAGGLLNPIGIQLVWQSALPGAAGAHSGLLWLRYYILKGTVPERRSDVIDRSYAWIIWLQPCRSFSFSCWDAGLRCTARLRPPDSTGRDLGWRLHWKVDVRLLRQQQSPI